MKSKPLYFKTFQALTKIRDEYTHMLLYRMQAYHSFYAGFNDFATVKSKYLKTINLDTLTAIYNDPDFGMASFNTLFYWSMACGDDFNAQASL